MTYKVPYTGYVIVEADSLEEAREIVAEEGPFRFECKIYDDPQEVSHIPGRSRIE